MAWLTNSDSDSSAPWSVGELTRYIRDLFEIDYRLQDVQVSGEISNFTRARSGHLYFTLKDDQAQLRCVMWRSSAEALQYLPNDGDAVLARGNVSVYEVGGQYQLYAKSIRPIGRGDLALAFEQLKAQLAAQGLFDDEHKKRVPEFPEKIGLVTSAQAAAFRDILSVLQRRWPSVSVLLAPSQVQGAEAPGQLARALRRLDERSDIDTIILARGGGSIEDLWAFNDEALAKTIFGVRHPVIVGVGHESDFTIADFVADLRAPTPSAAAELAVPDQTEMAIRVHSAQAELLLLARSTLKTHRAQAENLERSLVRASPKSRLDNSWQRLDWVLARLERAIGSVTERGRARLSIAEAKLVSVSPTATLNRGYAIVRKSDGRVVQVVGDVIPGERLSVQVSDGEFGVTAS